jgi:Calx-beta domain
MKHLMGRIVCYGALLIAAFETTAPAVLAQTQPPIPTVQFETGGSDSSTSANFTVNASDGSVTIVVTLSDVSAQTVTVNYATSDGTAVAGTDYQATSGTLTFPPGEVSETFQVTILDPGVPAPNKTVNLTLSNPQNATLGVPSTGIVTIIADTPPPQPSVAFSSSTYSVNESAGTATISVTLSSSSTNPVSVYYTTSDGTAVSPDDYQGTSGQLTFAPGDLSQFFTVNVTDNGVPGPNKTVNLTLSNPQNATLGSPGTAVLTIVNDNLSAPPGYVEFAGGDGTSTPPVYEVNKAAGSAIVTVIAGQSSQTISVNYATSDGTATAPNDYTPAAGTLTFPAGTTSQTFTVQLNQNSTTSTDVSLNLALSQPQNANLGNPSAAILEINEEKPTATIEPAAGQAGTTGDVVPSQMAKGGTKHYVSPKDPAGKGTVVLQANIVGKVKFADAFKWKGGTPVDGKPDQCTVSRAATGQTVVQIIRTADNAVMDTMNVWIVWADIASTQLKFDATGKVDPKGNAIYINATATGCSVKAGYSFVHTIAPAAIIGAAGSDTPDLTGKNDTPPPDVNAGDTDVYQKGVSLAKGADHHWDNSRSCRQKLVNPGKINFALKHPASLYSTYPNWPSFVGGQDVVGNDDAGTDDETNDPYANKGVLNGMDGPTRSPLNTEGAAGDTFEIRLNFAEFTRVEINKKWYRISDDYKWNINFKFKNTAGKWGDDGTSTALDWSNW